MKLATASWVPGELESPCAHRCCTRCRAIYYTDYERCPLDGEELVETDADPLIGATVAGHYVVEELIGEGAMGRVYRVHHSRLVHRGYALKVLLGDFAASASMRLRFASEAENASRLDHPNIAGVVDFGRTETGLLYLVMELVEGTSLSAIVRRGPMPPRRIAELARRLCDGLAHAHERGIVHRDFKPDNIIVVDDGTPRIVDFGIAISTRDDDMRLTTSGVMCTPAYAAPEQLVRGQVDHRADLYGLGVTMYEMATGGVMPFRGDPRKVMALKLTARPARVDRVQPMPAALAVVIHRLLERDPDARYASAADVVSAIDAAMAPAGRRRAPALLGVAAIATCCVAISERSVADEPARVASSDPVIDPPALVPPSTIGTALAADRIDGLAIPAPPGMARPNATAAAIGAIVRKATSSLRVERPRAKPARVARAVPPPVIGPDRAPVPTLDVPLPRLLVAAAPSYDTIAPTPELSPPSPPIAIPKPHPVRVVARDRTPQIVRLDVEGGLPPSVVRRAVERVLPQLSACQPISAGRPVAATFSVEQTRRASEIQVTGAAGRCVAAALGALRTEAEPDVGEARVQLSLGFP
jgi:serine/threonine-protein kinase